MALTPCEKNVMSYQFDNHLIREKRGDYPRMLCLWKQYIKIFQFSGLFESKMN